MKTTRSQASAVLDPISERESTLPATEHQATTAEQDSRAATPSRARAPAAALTPVHPQRSSNARERRQAATIRQLAAWSRQLPPLAKATRRAYTAGQGRILYIGPLGPPSRPASLYQAREWFGVLHREGFLIAALARPQYFRYRFGSGLVDPVGAGNAARFRELVQSARTRPLSAFVEHAARLIAAAAREHAASLVYCPSDPDMALPGLIAARSLGIAFVYDMRVVGDGSVFDRGPSGRGPELEEMRGAIERQVAGNADYVYAGSEALRAMLIDHGAAPERVATFPSCVNHSALPKAVPPPSERFIVGFAGPLTYAEGPRLLVESVAKLAARGVEAEAVLIGDGDLASELASLGARLGVADRVQLLGRKPWAESLHLLAAMHAVVFPRRVTGIGDLTAPVELTHAMGIGLPVAASNLLGFAHEIDNGVNGRLFAAGDSSALADVLAEWAQHPAVCADVGNEARKKVVRLRHHAAFADDASEFLRTLVPPGRRFRGRPRRPPAGAAGDRAARRAAQRSAGAEQTLAQELMARLEKPFPFDSVRAHVEQHSAECRPSRRIVGVMRPSSRSVERLHHMLRVDQGLFVFGAETAAFVFDATVIDELGGWEGCLSPRNNYANLALVKLLRTARSRQIPTILLFDGRSMLRPFFVDFADEFDHRIEVDDPCAEDRILELAGFTSLAGFAEAGDGR